MKLLPEEIGTQGFLFAGSSGSGKTLHLKRLVHSVLKGFGPSVDSRMVVYDFKAELFGFLYTAMARSAPGVPFYCLNPADRRSVWWHVAADVESESDCHAIASILLPSPPGDRNPYYTLATRNILARLMCSFMRHSPKRWYFRDLMCALSQKELYQLVLRRDDDTATALRMGSAEAESNTDSTINNLFNQFAIVAALSDAAQRAKHPPLSVRHWVRNPGVILLPMDPTLVSVLEPYYRVFFHMLTQHILALAESDTRRTWIILDEFNTLKPFESFPNYVTNGRSKGACTALALQHVNSVLDPGHYGGLGEVILGEMKNRMFFHASTSKHAEWCANEYGRNEFYKESTSSGEQWSNQFTATGAETDCQYTASRNYGIDYQTEYLRQPSEFQALSLVKNSGIIEAFSIIQGKRFRCSETLQSALSKNLKSDLPHLGFMRVPTDSEHLRRWTREDFDRLKLPHPGNNLFDLVMNLQPPKL
jgi:hypothetical protein